MTAIRSDNVTPASHDATSSTKGRITASEQLGFMETLTKVSCSFGDRYCATKPEPSRVEPSSQKAGLDGNSNGKKDRLSAEEKNQVSDAPERDDDKLRDIEASQSRSQVDGGATQRTTEKRTSSAESERSEQSPSTEALDSTSGNSGQELANSEETEFDSEGELTGELGVVINPNEGPEVSDANASSSIGPVIEIDETGGATSNSENGIFREADAINEFPSELGTTLNSPETGLGETAETLPNSQPVTIGTDGVDPTDANTKEQSSDSSTDVGTSAIAPGQGEVKELSDTPAIVGSPANSQTSRASSSDESADGSLENGKNEPLVEDPAAVAGVSEGSSRDASSDDRGSQKGFSQSEQEDSIKNPASLADKSVNERRPIASQVPVDSVNAPVDSSESRTSESVPATATNRGDLPTTVSTPNGVANLIERLSPADGAGRSLRNADGRNIDRTGELPPAQQRRLLNRVSRAFDLAKARDGEIRLRLTPAELGTLKLQLRVKDGVMNARLEAENQVAKTVLLEQLPLLRDRLSEQGIQIESFDVDLREESQNEQRLADERSQQELGRRDREQTSGKFAEREPGERDVDREIEAESKPENLLDNKSLNVVV